MTLIQTILFYLATILSIFIVSLVTKNSRHHRAWLFSYSLIVLTLISGLRSAEVGTDTQMYIDAYEEIGHSSFPFTNVRYEFGFSLLFNVCYKISSSPQFMLLVTSFIINFGVLYFIFKMSPDPSFSILLYLLSFNYFISFNLMRQYLGTAIALMFIPCLKKKHYLIYIIGCLISVLFHKINIVLILLVLCPFIKKNIPLFVVIACGAFAVFVLGDNILVPIIRMLNYDFYLTSVFFTSWGTMNALFDLMFPLICLVLILNSYSRKNIVYKQLLVPASNINSNNTNSMQLILYVDKVKTAELSTAQSISFYSIIVSACFSLLKINWWIMNRLASIFSCVGILIVPVILKNSKNYKINKSLILISYLALFIVGAFGLHNFNDAFIYSFGAF